MSGLVISYTIGKVSDRRKLSPDLKPSSTVLNNETLRTITFRKDIFSFRKTETIPVIITIKTGSNPNSSL